MKSFKQYLEATNPLTVADVTVWAKSYFKTPNIKTQKSPLPLKGADKESTMGFKPIDPDSSEGLTGSIAWFSPDSEDVIMHTNNNFLLRSLSIAGPIYTPLKFGQPPENT